MYHCSLIVQIFSSGYFIENILRETILSERFTLEYRTLETFSAESARQADIVVFDIPMPCCFTAVREHCKAEALIILCAEQIFIEQLTESAYAALDGVWVKPLSTQYLQFSFRQLLAGLQVKKESGLYRNYLYTAMDSIPDLVWFKDLRGAHLVINRAFCETVGKKREDVEGRGHFYIWDIEPEEYEKGEYVCLESEEIVMAARKTCVFDEKVKGKNGMRQFKTYKSPLFGDDGALIGTVGVAHDVTDLGNMSVELEIILRSMPFAVLLYNGDGKIININKKFEEFFQEEKTAILNTDYEVWQNKTLTFVDKVSDEGNRLARYSSGEEERIFEVREEAILDAFRNMVGYICIFRDVTFERLLEEQIMHNANTDFLTGLYNRRCFYEYLGEKREALQISFLSIDLDNFKKVNDTFGHQVGDTALIVAADTIVSSFPDDFVVRLGGDEFLVVLLARYTPEELAGMAGALLERMKKIFQGSRQFKLMTASIGIAWTNDVTMDIDELLKQGDMALYEAKQRGKSCYCFYHEICDHS